MFRELTFVFVAFLLFLNLESAEIKNQKYDRKSSNNDPDIYLTPPKIIRRYGYPAEEHIIQSEDGYLLEYHRIPHGRNAPAANKSYPVLLHHGVTCTSIVWIINGPEKSLAYRLADEGYDVWMVNDRGNTYSRSHVTMSPEQKGFWNFTFHEMAMFDLPAAVNYILNATNSKKLIHIGHSMGTTTFYAFASTKPEFNDKILVHISLAPVGGLSHTTSILRLFVPFAEKMKALSDWYDKGAFLEHDWMVEAFADLLCGSDIFNYNLCEQLIVFELFGKDPEQFNTSLIPITMSHMPAGTSSKNMIHGSQLISSGKLQYYDYGKENMQRYHSATPPVYNLSRISVPIKFYYGQNDILASPMDVKLLYQQLPRPMGCTVINYQKWNHPDFIWAIDANRLFNDELIQFLKNVTDVGGFVDAEIKRALQERDLSSISDDIPFDENRFLTNNLKVIARMNNNRITNTMRTFLCKNSVNDCGQNLNENLSSRSKYSYDLGNDSSANSTFQTKHLFVELRTSNAPLAADEIELKTGNANLHLNCCV